MHRAVRTSSLALLCAGFAFGLPAAAGAADFAQVYQDALASDPTYQQAYATYMAAREARPEAWASLLPQIYGIRGQILGPQRGASRPSSSRSRRPDRPASLSTPARARRQKNWSLNLSEDLFSWTDWMNLKAADSQVAEAQATYEAAAQNLILRVATAYFNVLSALDTLQAQESSLQAYRPAAAAGEQALSGRTDRHHRRRAGSRGAGHGRGGGHRRQAIAGNAEDQLQVITGRQYPTLSEPGA